MKGYAEMEQMTQSDDSFNFLEQSPRYGLHNSHIDDIHPILIRLQAHKPDKSEEDIE